MMNRVILESPLAGDFARNKAYARLCMRDCLMRGESPYASHLLFDQPGILDDTIPEERELGIQAGFAWHEGIDTTAVYTDFGISDGMVRGIERAKQALRAVSYRTLSVPEGCYFDDERTKRGPFGVLIQADDIQALAAYCFATSGAAHGRR